MNLVVSLIQYNHLFETTFPEFVKMVEANKHAFRSYITSIFYFINAT